MEEVGVGLLVQGNEEADVIQYLSNVSNIRLLGGHKHKTDRSMGA